MTILEGMITELTWGMWNWMMVSVSEGGEYSKLLEDQTTGSMVSLLEYLWKIILIWLYIQSGL